MKAVIDLLLPGVDPQAIVQCIGQHMLSLKSKKLQNPISGGNVACMLPVLPNAFSADIAAYNHHEKKL
jgi:hypothetical protein